MTTDYTPGDPPVPKGRYVKYHEGLWRIVDRMVIPQGCPDPEVNYPDGVAYVLLPADVLDKMDNRHLSRLFVRRTSFQVVPIEEEES